MAASGSTKAAARKPRPPAKKAAAKKSARKPRQTTAAAVGGNKIRIPPRGELISVDALDFYEKDFGPNPRQHPPENLEEIRQAINKFGFCQPLLINENNVVLDGNGRLIVLREMGQKKIPCWRVYGMTKEEQRLAGLNMNALAKRGVDDYEKLTFQLAEAVRGGFSPETLENLGWDENLRAGAAAMSATSDAIEELRERFGYVPDAPPEEDDDEDEKGFGGFKQSGDFKIPASRLAHLDAGGASPTPLTWHGGKTRLLPYLIPIVESVEGATFYMEPFAGGAALLWGLRTQFPSEVINDRLDAVVAFWETMQKDFGKFHALLHERGLHAETYFRKAQAIMSGEVKPKNRVELAWAVFYSTAVSHSHTGTGGFVVSYEQSSAKIFRGKLKRITDKMVERIEEVSIRNEDAVKLIRVHGKDGRVLMYCDPPYVLDGRKVEQGHYAGYTKEDFTALLTALSQVSCKFIMSSYPSEQLTEFKNKFGWYQVELVGQKSSHPGSVAVTGDKVEVVTTNFLPSFRQQKAE